MRNPPFRSTVASAAAEDERVRPDALRGSTMPVTKVVEMRTLDNPFLPVGTEEVISQELTLCRTCKVFKPPSTHHCRKCGFCVNMHDHHCEWLGTCIGARNRHPFIVMCLVCSLWSGLLSVGAIVGTVHGWHGGLVGTSNPHHNATAEATAAEAAHAQQVGRGEERSDEALRNDSAA